MCVHMYLCGQFGGVGTGIFACMWPMVGGLVCVFFSIVNQLVIKSLLSYMLSEPEPFTYMWFAKTECVFLFAKKKISNLKAKIVESIPK